MMEWKISFVPNDIANMTTAAAERKINPKVVLNIRLGIGPAVVGKDIIVEDLSFQGTMVSVDFTASRGASLTLYHRAED